MTLPVMQVEILKDTASPAIARLLGNLKNPRPVMEVMANAARRTVQDYFRARPPNKLGWPSSGFWRRMAGATSVAEVTERDATIAISDPAIAQRVHGGTITPKRGRYLAIPAGAAAYAAGAPREGGGPSNLAFVYSRHPQGGWRPALAVREAVFKEVGKPRKDGTRRTKLVHQVATVWYWLVRSATQAADPEALPPPELLQASCTSSALAFLGTQYGARSQLA